jgi:uncharacterized protein YijF (DUF1287 family)
MACLLAGTLWLTAAGPVQEVRTRSASPAPTGLRIVEAARQQLSWGTTYDPSYVRLKFPNGDVPRDKGVCTDLVVRALRAAGHDLQALIFRDKAASPGAYPKVGGRGRPDPNIDHRRCSAQRAFFKRHARALGTKTGLGSIGQWQPGDIVFWILDNGRDHVGIVSDRKGRSGLPMVIHNIYEPAEEDALTSWRIVAHFRYPP